MGFLNQPIILNFIKIVVAILCGGLIGIQRSKSFRTAPGTILMIFTVGSTLFVIVSLVLTPGLLIDPSRIAGDVMIGVGLIGVFAIFKEKDVLTGITKAASIWMAGAIGLTIGAGLFLEGIAITIFVYLLAGRINKKEESTEENES